MCASSAINTFCLVFVGNLEVPTLATIPILVGDNITWGACVAATLFGDSGTCVPRALDTRFTTSGAGFVAFAFITFGEIIVWSMSNRAYTAGLSVIKI